MVSFILSVVGSLLAAVLWAELEGWGPLLGRRLLEFGVRKLPEDRRARYLEEWCAHQDDMPTPLSKLLVGFGFAAAGIREGVRVRRPRWSGLLAREAVIRSYEIGLSSVALMMFAPLFVVIAIAIRKESPGPVLDRRLRLGRSGQRFTMYKFRTRRVGHVQPTDRSVGSRDPRITKVGLVLRRTSLDELPQLLNVLSGSMSFVGHRPPAEWHCLDDRHKIIEKPGLVPVPEDLASGDKPRSVRSYFRILLRTAAFVFFDRG